MPSLGTLAACTEGVGRGVSRGSAAVAAEAPPDEAAPLAPAFAAAAFLLLEPLQPASS